MERLPFSRCRRVAWDLGLVKMETYSGSVSNWTGGLDELMENPERFRREKYLLLQRRMPQLRVQLQRSSTGESPAQRNKRKSVLPLRKKW